MDKDKDKDKLPLKVDNVILCRRGDQVVGRLSLAQHHLVFSYLAPNANAPPGTKQRPKELWITYPMISFCTYRPMPPAYRQSSSIRLRCRDFTFVAFQLEDPQQAKKVYDTIRSLTCCLGHIEKLYAFSYNAPPAEKEVNGWEIYDARKEFKRMGIGPKEADRGWRLSDINKDYTYSPTYPGLLVVPSTISDNVLRYGGSYRSKTRIPALTYLHSVNNCSITRSAQPLVGMFQGKRNAQDERLVAAIFATSTPAPATSGAAADAASLSAVVSEAREAETGSAPEVDLASSQDSISLSIGSDENAFPQSFGEPDVTTAQPLPPKIYGAQQRNFIVDARPQINAVANQATGMGSENMEYYKDATKEFLGIANIHVMRDSLNKVVEAFANSDYTNFPPSQDILAKSKWLDYITILLRGADLVARQVGVHHSHVLIHCSDGWDRTSQIAALSELCLDPYYRTMEGFIVLVEKDFLSFGHMFRHRSGFLSSEKWFEVENERISGGAKGKEQDAAAAGANGGSNAFENALFAARGFFNQKKNDSRESLHIDPADAAPSGLSSVNKHATKVKETSPIFHQFLDATYQLLYQHPDRFEFTERFLRRLLYQLYACQYGTFLYDSERERVEAHVAERTRSVWDHFLSRREQFTNPSYDGTIDDKVPGKERLLFPDMRKVRWWPEVFGRTDEEMNGSVHAPAASLPKENGALREPLVRGIENSEMSIGPAANGSSTGASSPLPSQLQNNIGASAFANGAEKLSTSLANLGFGVRSTAASSASNSRSRTPPGAKTEQQASVVDSAIDSSGRAAMSPPRREDMFSAFARDNAFRDS